MAINNLFNIGTSALNASSAWIAVTGNNIANADTEGYSRQYVVQNDIKGLTVKPGAHPLGVDATQVLRYFDYILEGSYIDQSSTSARWDRQDTVMASLENLFNESNRSGISSALNNFFDAWQDLSLRPDDTATRVSLVSFADNLNQMFRNTVDSIKVIQDEMNVSIKQDAARVNELSKAIADLNRQISRNTIEGISNPNALLDDRDQLVREMATILDVETIDNGKGNFRVQLSSGQPLVEGIQTYEIRMLPPQSETVHVSNTNFDCIASFDGNDSYEYTVEFIDDKKFRVSLDGGRTWLKDEDGKQLELDINFANRTQVLDDNGQPMTGSHNKNVFKSEAVQVKNLSISFTFEDGFTPAGQDNYVITPKEGLYWIEPTRGPENITTQIGLDGIENAKRVTGGTIAAYFSIRDDACGRYLDGLDAVSNSLIWEVNRLHSQGVGLSMFSEITGQQNVGNEKAALGTAQSLLSNYDRLEKGSVNFHFFDKNTGKYVASTLLNFDPSSDSLEDVRDAINNMTLSDGTTQQTFITAEIQTGKLIIRQTDPNVEFALGADSSGLMAALGINTFFTGTGAENIAVNSAVYTNTNLVASGQVNGQFQINSGDNITAVAIGNLINKPVTISTVWKTVNNQSITEYYADLVAGVGADRRLSKTNAEYNQALTDDLYERISSISGVSLDEEMANLVKFQHSYTAAAKMITTADEMLQTLLGIKQ